MVHHAQSAPAPQPGQGEPPWLTIVLAVIGALVTLGGAYLTFLATRGRSRPDTESGSPPQMPTPPNVPRTPRTADEQLDFARELVAEIKADRDKLAVELEHVRRRVAEQDALIERLQSVIDAWSRQAPPPPPPHRQMR